MTKPSDQRRGRILESIDGSQRRFAVVADLVVMEKMSMRRLDICMLQISDLVGGYMLFEKSNYSPRK
ncbi:hypothetical protein Hanom_Chr14g01270981 [Helianthus anomalus]